MIIQGYFLDGQSSKRVAAKLVVVEAGYPYLQLELANEQVVPEAFGSQFASKKRLEFTDLFIESRLGNTPREIVINNEQMFVSADNEGVDQLIRFFHGVAKRAGGDSLLQSGKVRRPATLIYYLEKNLTMIALSLVLTIVVMWGFVTYGLPAAAKYIAFNLPSVVSRQLGSTLTVLDKTFFDPTTLSEQKQAEIRALIAPYSALYPDLNINVHFRSGMPANAFALPTGDIVFTDDFVNLVENDDQLLSVFFHELGHVQHRHILRRTIQGSILTVVGVLVIGDLDTADVVVAVPTLLMDLSYSREFEHDADSFAFAEMKKNNIPVVAFAEIMQRLEDHYRADDDLPNFGFGKNKTLKTYLSSHPATEDRIERARHYEDSDRP